MSDAREIGPDAFIPGFRLADIDVGGGITIRVAHAGEGPPLLLLHGHPQTHVTWRKIAPALAGRFSVVCPDLRGYGDSSKPEGAKDHSTYSKRAMAADQVAVMRAFGHETFRMVGHDRGGRVGHRLALDFPEALEKLVLFDIAPTATMYARTDKDFASRYFWWFFLIQEAPLPERMILGDVEFYLREHVERQNKISGATEEAVFQEYLRCYRSPEGVHAVCEDYRAAATIDLEHDAADADRWVECPLLALWGARGVVGRTYDVLETWREKAREVSGRAVDCGHTLQEEAPEETLRELLAFL
ncbi:alpha/beta fold hydrolase [Chelatococcus sambhunathii]|uniref:alpha/beta fold hydrolase n=1 Tax=Chelatococcus sambhunathii TaxID=363953 RepID=UPI002852A2C0|nr:alpha/beta hydrolase [Chelatococcus sambhunathii]